MNDEQTPPPVGSILAISNAADPGRHLGLVVDQERGRKWVERDPALGYEPDPEDNTYVLVRLLSEQRISYLTVSRNPVPAEDPEQTQIVRWEYAQFSHGHARVVAGPDVESIAEFLRIVRICHGLGMGNAPFVNSLGIIVEHLRDVQKEPGEMRIFGEKGYRAMLKDVLPLSK